MHTRRPFLGRLRGVTGTDLLVLISVLSVLAALWTARQASVRQKSRLLRCTANLQQINAAVHGFCGDHNQTLPGPSAELQGNLWWWYKEQVKGYANLKGPSSTNDALFACPDDRGYSDPVPFCRSERFDFSSYVFNGVTLPGMPNIAGRDVASVRTPQRTLLVMEWTAHAPLSWHHSKTGERNMPFYSNAESVVGFLDGHVSLTKIYYDGYNAAFTRDPIDAYEYKYSGD